MKNAIEIKNLKKNYSNFKLDIKDLKIKEGAIVGLIGENGAGKTTLIKSILNIIKNDNGTIKIFDYDYKKEEQVIKEDIGVVLDDMFFPEILSPKDINLIMKDVFKKWDSEVFFDYLKKLGISSNKKIKELSKGMRKKLEIVVSLSHNPKLLILDEPTSGLDPVVRNEVLDIFLEFIKDENHTILLSTHITSDLEHIADQIVFINNGSIVIDNLKDELIDNYGILKCDLSYFDKIEKVDIIKYKKNKYEAQILIADRKKIGRKYKDCVIDKITLEDLMVLMIKGEK
ncbi:MAG: ABC transporter ATP-binding protein [Bacilli bacterium]|nr:ABC transporter ATP-binding protein [Bacilli bacterium]